MFRYVTKCYAVLCFMLCVLYFKLFGITTDLIGIIKTIILNFKFNQRYVPFGRLRNRKPASASQHILIFQN